MLSTATFGTNAVDWEERIRFDRLRDERLARLRAELREFIRKNDYRFRDEPWGDEKTAPQRAVAKLGGDA